MLVKHLECKTYVALHPFRACFTLVDLWVCVLSNVLHAAHSPYKLSGRKKVWDICPGVPDFVATPPVNTSVCSRICECFS